MFIELAEHLRCPANHNERTHLVVVPEEMAGRSVMRGVVACPICRTEYPVQQSVTVFGVPPIRPAGATLPGLEALRALLLLDGPGGYVVLVGAAGSLAPGFAAAQSDVPVVVVNGAAAEALPDVSPLTSVDGIPLQDGVARGVVVGPDYAGVDWMAEAVRVLARGRRIVVLADIGLPEPIEIVARGQGMTVGVRRMESRNSISSHTMR